MHDVTPLGSNQEQSEDPPPGLQIAQKTHERPRYQ